MPSHFVIEGLKELEAEMKAIDRKLLRGITKANKAGAIIVANAARGGIPVKTGAMAAACRPTSGPLFFGARINDPGAGVQAFATTYIRRVRGSTQTDSYHHRELKTGISRGLKKYYKATGKTGGSTEEVHMVNVHGSPPRFLFNVIEERGSVVARDVVFPAIIDALQANGWWE